MTRIPTAAAGSSVQSISRCRDPSSWGGSKTISWDRAALAPLTLLTRHLCGRDSVAGTEAEAMSRSRATSTRHLSSWPSSETAQHAQHLYDGASMEPELEKAGQGSPNPARSCGFSCIVRVKISNAGWGHEQGIDSDNYCIQRTSGCDHPASHSTRQATHTAALTTKGHFCRQGAGLGME
jgi:hypothetical protein